jgi:hypothetical protein
MNELDERYKGVGVYDLGNLVTKRIHTYAETRKEAILSEIFAILLELTRRTLVTRYHDTSLFDLEDALQQIAEDMLLNISRQPEHYFYPDNFYPYCRRVVLIRASAYLKEFFAQYSHRVSMEEYKDEVECNIPLPVDVLSQRDKYRIFINHIYFKLKGCPRFRKRRKYLLWPMVISILYEQSQMFDSLSFKDRVGLRIMRCVISRKSYLHT